MIQLVFQQNSYAWESFWYNDTFDSDLAVFEFSLKISTSEKQMMILEIEYSFVLESILKLHLNHVSYRTSEWLIFHSGSVLAITNR